MAAACTEADAGTGTDSDVDDADGACSDVDTGADAGAETDEAARGTVVEDTGEGAETLETAGLSRIFGALATDLGTAFLTLGTETTFTFTLLLSSDIFVRNLLMSSSETLQYLQVFLYLWCLKARAVRLLRELFTIILSPQAISM